MIRNFDQWIKSLTKEETPNPISAMVEDIREDFRAELNCPTEEELCGYVDGTLKQVDLKHYRAIENHHWGTPRHRPCLLCHRDVQELCEILEEPGIDITPEQLAQQVLSQETPNVQEVMKFIPLLRDDWKEVRIEAAEAMREWGKQYRNWHHVRYLLPLLNDEKGEVRGNAAILIGELGSPFDNIWLKPLLDDENPEVQQYADNALEKLWTTVWRPRLWQEGKGVHKGDKTSKSDGRRLVDVAEPKKVIHLYSTEDAPNGNAHISPSNGQPLALAAGIEGVIPLDREEAPAPLEQLPDTLVRFGDRLFRFGLEFQNDLDKERISNNLRQEFKNNGISLSENMIISIEEPNNEWLITDAHKAYSVRKREDRLYVYSDKFAVELYVSPTSEGRFTLKAVIYTPKSIHPQEKPISNVAVRIIKEDGTVGSSKETDKEGKVYIGAYKPGQYAIRFEHADITRHIIVDLE